MNWIFYSYFVAVQHERGPRNSTLRKQRQEKYIRFATSEQYIYSENMKQCFLDESSNLHLISSITVAEPLVTKVKCSDNVSVSLFTVCINVIPTVLMISR